MRTFVVGAVIAAGMCASSYVCARDLTFEDRVEAQKAIEEVYWRHRTWPNENPSPKPSLDAVMPKRVLRAKVEDYLRKSDALEKIWGRAVSVAELQAEIERMASRTRAGAVLAEIFDALGNDATLIAETLARQSLADRLVRGRYARDRRFHDAVRARAEAALARHTSITDLKNSAARYTQQTWRLSPSGTGEPLQSSEETRASLGPKDWSILIGRLASDLASPGSSLADRAPSSSPSSLPRGVLSPLREQDDAFYATEILRADSNSVTTATLSWPKAPFDVWWASRRATFSTSITTPPGEFALVTPNDSTCTADTWSAMESDVMDPRTYHTAVWTGTEMIVWGGNINSYVTSTGGRYSPATDTWVPTPTGGDAPSERYQHSAVWTGTEMILWGGEDAIGHNTNTGGRYDPATNTWQAMSIGGAPSARLHPSMFWTGNKVLIWGGDGCNPGCEPYATGGLYDPVTGVWSSMNASGAPVGRYQYSAVWTGTSMIVWGGHTGSPQSPVRTGGRYDPATDSWRPTSSGANVPAARYGQIAVWTGTEMIVWGGATATAAVVTGGRYNPVTDTWLPTSTGASVPSSRQYETSVWDGRRMIVWGGDVNGASGATNTGGRYDPMLDSWTPTNTGAGTAEPREYHTAVWTGTEMLIWGGYINYGYTGGLTSTGARYNPETDSWITMGTGSTPVGRSSHAAVWTGAEMIVWGGSGLYGYFNSGGRYDPVTDSWRPTSLGSNVPDARIWPTAVWTGTEMVVWGGFTSAALMNSGGRYSPVTDSWRPTSLTGAPIARRGNSAVWTGRELIIWGGAPSVSGPGGLKSGGRYDPNGDRWTATNEGSTAPAARGGHTAVFVNGRMIVWGGSLSAGSTNTGAQYDPSTDAWSPTSFAAGVPNARYSHSAVVANGRMIVWGGQTNLISGGIYDPILDSWTPTNDWSDQVPLTRSGNIALWTGTHMLVWGGNGGYWPNFSQLNTGGSYDPVSDSWAPTSIGFNDPTPRQAMTAVWTGTEMIIWGGDGPVTSTGGRYCACPSGRLVYRDADGDGFGDPSASFPICDGLTPPGFVLDHTDCNDADPNTHPGVIEVCNGVDDNCDGIVDNGGSALCSDGNVCTDDACLGAGGCGHANNLAACDDGNACTQNDACLGGSCLSGPAADCDDGNPCTDDSCSPGSGCEHGANTAPCDDGNSCTAGDICRSGTCQGTTIVCNDNNPCTDDSCNPASGCVYVNNTSSCDDGNPCTDDSCDPALGCVHADNTASCEDGNACTSGDVCVNGSCVGGSTLNCNDGNPCTDDSCNPATGCVYVNNTASCNDGSACTTGDTCGGGSCHGGAAVSCNDGNGCTDDSCNPATGCVHVNNTVSCDDGDACTTGDTCGGGSCHGGAAVSCNDGNDCTDDSCNPATGCVHSNNTASCNDGNACTHSDSCQAGVCTGGNPVVCAALDPCHDVGVCTPATGVCSNPAKADGTACSDGNACTQSDSCQGGSCVGTNPVVCTASDACHLAGSCHPGTGACSNPAKADGAACSDGNSCTQSDSCQAGVCTGGSPVVCTALDPCHDVGICTSATGVCSSPVKADGTACSDGNACTLSDACQAGSCVGTNPVVCTASDACHVAGSCNPGTGECSNPAKANGTICNDGNACTQADACQAGSCVGTNPVVCTASDSCHVAGTCDPQTGACPNPAAPDGTACNDGNGCTQSDTCQAGSCVGASPVVCTASDACHLAGTCNPGTGACSNPVAQNGTACSDGNACTQSDSCQGGSCVGTNPVVCTASDVCHVAGSCNPGTGACSSPAAQDGTPCGDAGTECTNQDSCLTGVCHDNGFKPSGTACGNPATSTCNHADTCNGAGVCQPNLAPDGTLCNDGNPCTTGDRCATGVCQPGPGALSCNDNNPCTDDSCSPTAGCLHANNTIACDDGNACTVGDTCSLGTCHAGATISAPPETQGVAVGADKATYSWSAATDATHYDVLRGSTGAFPVGPGGGDEVCFDKLAGPSLVDSATPALGSGFWYLARGENICGFGTWGLQSNGPPRTTMTCP